MSSDGSASSDIRSKNQFREKSVEAGRGREVGGRGRGDCAAGLPVQQDSLHFVRVGRATMWQFAQQLRRDAVRPPRGQHCPHFILFRFSSKSLFRIETLVSPNWRHVYNTSFGFRIFSLYSTFWRSGTTSKRGTVHLEPNLSNSIHN